MDPDGTLGVARGNVAIVNKNKTDQALMDTLTDEQKTRVDRHYHGSSQTELAIQRRQQLALDDANPAPANTNNTNNSNSKMTESQARHLKQRHSKKTSAVLQRLESKRLQAAVSAIHAVEVLQDSSVGVLEAEHDMERTTAVTQTQLKRHYLSSSSKDNDNNNVCRNIFDLQLPHAAPYCMKYDRSGRYAVLAGKGGNGHVAVLDNLQQSLVTEFHLPRERIRDATFLHNFTMTAVAQSNAVYIYDHTGAEVHCMDQHSDPNRLAFLPYHWLLASIGRAGYLKYQDVSTGSVVSTHRTRLGPATALVSNPANAVLHAGHTNGTVTLWSPAQPNFVAKLLCHKGAAVTDIAIDLEGRTMVTAGQDRQIKVWDLRTYQQRHAYYCAAGVPVSLDISQRGLLAIGHAGHVTIWNADALQRKAQSPYMHHVLGPSGDNAGRGPVTTVRFRPFEDACGIGHAAGVSSIVVPGSGEPALDTAEYNTNPMADVKQRREAEVRALLDKLSPDMITLDANAVGGIEESDAATRLERLHDLQDAANEAAANAPPAKEKNKKRGRSKIQTKLRRKAKNVIDQNLIRLRETREKEALAKQVEQQQSSGVSTATQKDGRLLSNESTKESAPTALKRFF